MADWSEKRMQIGLYHWLYKKGQRWITPNAREIFSTGESDILSLMKSGLANEFEVKISRSDFKADAKKGKYELFEKRISGHREDIRIRRNILGHAIQYRGPMSEFYTVRITTPNYFYYVVPDGLISIDEIPAFAGLVYANERCFYFQIVKKAPLIHGDIDETLKTQLGIKLMHRFWAERDKTERFWTT